MRKLEPEEKETIILFDRADAIARIYTYERTWQTYFKNLGVKPVSINAYGGAEYAVPKRWIRIPRPPRRSKNGDNDV